MASIVHVQRGFDDDRAPAGLAAPPAVVSVVIPLFNEARRVPDLARAIRRWTPPFGAAEVILVDDGSTDGTADLLRTELDDRIAAGLTVLHHETNRGKGAAVKTGVDAAAGQFVAFLDADLSVEFSQVDRALSVMQHDGLDVAFGSRRHPETKIPEPQPLGRRLSGRAFNLMVRGLNLSRWRDTQCGFKVFSRKAALATFPLVESDGFAFDVELLLLAEQQGFHMAPIPVTWRHRDGSKVRPVHDGAAMARSLWEIRRRVAWQPSRTT